MSLIKTALHIRIIPEGRQEGGIEMTIITASPLPLVPWITAGNYSGQKCSECFTAGPMNEKVSVVGFAKAL